jgi:hypothetical protein
MTQALTANRLIDGTVLYWKNGGWVEAFAEAELFDGTAGNAALAAAKEFVAANAVVNPYLLEVLDGKPVKEREIIRASGPSVRPDLGKQADGPALPFAPAPHAAVPVPEKDDDVSI